jgi:predicted molibdopterin-dependent oxidoreductase YjgC
VKYLIVQDTNVTQLAQVADAVIAGATFAEKAGSYVNADGRIQYSAAALPPRDGSLPDLDVFAILLGRGAAPIRSGDVLAELAGVIPGFDVAEEGRLPEFGIGIGETGKNLKAAVPFNDAWTLHRGAQIYAAASGASKTDRNL